MSNDHAQTAPQPHFRASQLDSLRVEQQREQLKKAQQQQKQMHEQSSHIQQQFQQRVEPRLTHSTSSSSSSSSRQKSGSEAFHYAYATGSASSRQISISSSDSPSSNTTHTPPVVHSKPAAVCCMLCVVYCVSEHGLIYTFKPTYTHIHPYRRQELALPVPPTAPANAQPPPRTPRATVPLGNPPN
jgi:Na+-transporting NADH:ubiquinone oxidoreductase subunit NqrC